MPRQYKLYLKDILTCIDHVETYTKGMSYEEFCENQLVMDAVLRNLEIIGEAIKKMPDDIINKKDYEWGMFARMRDVITHFYFGIKNNIIWGIVKRNLPDIKRNVNELLQEL